MKESLFLKKKQHVINIGKNMLTTCCFYKTRFVHQGFLNFEGKRKDGFLYLFKHFLYDVNCI